MVIHYTNIYNNVVFPYKMACIFRFKGRKSCANGDSVTLEFMINATKTKEMVICFCRNDNHVASIPRIVIDDNDIDRVTQAKVL